ncbi:hypothetical protein RBSWK_00301 [Rhodopirellula baltica SWK14]|uniref:Uncharacterized protein n=1 Tax=Rhodopirellula baltica SWK14 TaxID=993516 RepID=L7CNN0_RHOBT|nr:hypothetical protein RBSWK_00301 [Rhodopirellula baltica SWK14]
MSDHRWFGHRLGLNWKQEKFVQGIKESGHGKETTHGNARSIQGR